MKSEPKEYLQGRNQAKILKKSVILFWLLNPYTAMGDYSQNKRSAACCGRANFFFFFFFFFFLLLFCGVFLFAL